jgi:hypothetical protein
MAAPTSAPPLTEWRDPMKSYAERAAAIDLMPRPRPPINPGR